MMDTHFTVWSRPNCPYCIKAKALLTERGFRFTEVQLVAENAAEFKRITDGAKTVPQIFYHENGGTKLIGGFTDLEKWSG